MQQVDIAQHLVDRYPDYLFALKLSEPSNDQPGYGRCMHARIAKWTRDARVLEKINVVYSEIEFDKLSKISYSNPMMLLSLFNYNFVSANVRCNMLEDPFELRLIIS